MIRQSITTHGRSPHCVQHATVCLRNRSVDHSSRYPPRQDKIACRKYSRHTPGHYSCTASSGSKMSQTPTSDTTRANEIKGVLLRDYNQGQYLVTGNLTEAIYKRFCRVLDPTGVIWGIKLYQAILARLFDPRQSTVKLKSITVEGPSSLVASWTKEGFLQLPWRPYLTTQHGKTYYTLDKNGLICIHKQTWDNMTALQAIKIALTPTSGKKP